MILRRSLEEPLRQIVANAGDDSSVILNKVVEGKGNFGYNAATGEYGDMFEFGFIDPTKVTELPKDEKGAPMPDMGGIPQVSFLSCLPVTIAGARFGLPPRKISSGKFFPIH